MSNRKGNVFFLAMILVAATNSISLFYSGKYLVYGQPNPGNTREKTKTIEVEIVGGKAIEIELQANGGSNK